MLVYTAEKLLLFWLPVVSFEAGAQYCLWSTGHPDTGPQRKSADSHSCATCARAVQQHSKNTLKNRLDTKEHCEPKSRWFEHGHLGTLDLDLQGIRPLISNSGVGTKLGTRCNAIRFTSASSEGDTTRPELSDLNTGQLFSQPALEFSKGPGGILSSSCPSQVGLPWWSL